MKKNLSVRIAKYSFNLNKNIRKATCLLLTMAILLSFPASLVYATSESITTTDEPSIPDYSSTQQIDESASITGLGGNLSSEAVIDDLRIGGVLDSILNPEPETIYTATTEFHRGHLSFNVSSGATVVVTFNGTVLGEDNNYWLEFNGGENVLEIQVTSEDGINSNTYRVNVTRNLSSQAVILGLIIYDVLDWVDTPDPDIVYDVTTERQCETLQFDNPYGATTEVVFNGTELGGDTAYRLDFSLGLNVLLINVTSADGTNTNTYRINITRNLSSQAVIEGLQIGDVLEQVDFPDPETTYTAVTELREGYLSFNSPYGATTEVTFNGTILDNDSGYWLDFITGENVVEIQVTSADGSNTNTYRINITRNLSSQAVIGYFYVQGVIDWVQPPDPEIVYYASTERQISYLSFNNPYGATTEVTFNGTVLDEENYYQLDFVAGENIIQIQVTSEDGFNTNTYRINITRTLSSRAIIENLYMGDILDCITTPELEYNLTTERRGDFLGFDNPYGSTVEVTFNGTILGQAAGYWTGYWLDFITGNNVVEIQVTSADGTNTNIYRVNITRNQSSQAILEYFSVENALDYVHDPDPETVYTATTQNLGGFLYFNNPYGATTIVKYNGKVVGYESHCWLGFTVGLNVLEIQVTSEDGVNTNTYRINITRNPYSQAVIEDLHIYGVLDEVSTPETEYNLTTKRRGALFEFCNPYHATTKVTFNGTVLGEDDYYWLDFITGENVIEIQVTSEDGENTNIYVININRVPYSQAVLDELYLSGLLDWAETPDLVYNFTTLQRTSYLGFFSSNYATTKVTFNNTVLGEDTWYKLDFIPGLNVIEIKVTSEDGTNTTIYRINITRDLSSQAVIEDLCIEGVLDLVATPELGYNLTTELRVGYLSFENPFWATTEVTFNGTVLGDETSYRLDFINGENVVEIKVTSGDETKSNTYVINIMRSPSSEAVIENLHIYDLLDVIDTPESEYDLLTELQNVYMTFHNPHYADIEVTINDIAVIGEFTPYDNHHHYSLRLVNGENVIRIKVTSEDGTNTNSYVINITRSPYSQALIEGLCINGVLNYIYAPETEYDVTTLYRTAYLEFDNNYCSVIKVKLNGEVLYETVFGWFCRRLDFVPGLNVLEILVTSEDGVNTNTYTINITRNLSSQAVIENLRIDGVLELVPTPEFTYNVTTELPDGYLRFDNPSWATTEVKFNGTVLSESASYQLHFVAGENLLEIKVTSGDGLSTNTYVVNISREFSSKAVIQYLSISGVYWTDTPELESNVTTECQSGILEFGNLYCATTKVTLNGVTVLGNEGGYYLLDFTSGLNVLEIIVTSEDGSNTVTYRINITRNLSSQADIEYLSINEILDFVEMPELEYNVTTYLSASALTFYSPYGINSEVTLNGVAVFEDEYGYYWLEFVKGLNVLEIQVVSADGSNTKTYRIKITRNLSSHAVIEDLYLYEIFASGSISTPVLEYNITSPLRKSFLQFRSPYGATTEVKLNGTVLDETYDWDNGYREILYRLDLTSELNEIEIQVTSSDGTNTRIYRINIARELSAKAVIEDLQIRDVLDWVDVPDPSVEYSVTTRHKSSYLRFSNRHGATTEVTLNGSLLFMEFNGDDGHLGDYGETYGLDFINGENVILIKVTSSDGANNNIYRIKVLKVPMPKSLRTLINGIPDLVEEYLDAPYTGEGAVERVVVHVNAYLKEAGETDITPTVVEVVGPTAQEDGTTYVGQYMVTLARGTESVNKPLTYTQTKLPTPLQDIANGIPDFASEYLNAPFIAGALERVEAHVTAYLNETGELGITSTVVEVAGPTVQEDGTTYVGQYMVTLERGTESVNKPLTYTQTKLPTPLQDILDGILDLVEEYLDAPYTGEAAVERVEAHVNAYVNETGEAGITPTVVEVTGPMVQEDGTTYVGQYTVTLERGTESVNKLLTYTQTQLPTPLQDIANGIPDLASEYLNAPFIAGALERVEAHVTAYLNETGEADITPTVVEVTGPTVQEDGTTYIGKYTVTLTRGAETASKTLTYTQTKRPAPLQDILDGILDLVEEYLDAPYTGEAAVERVEAHVNAWLNETGEAGITPTVVEVTGPTVQEDGTTYVGQYTVKLERGAESVNKPLTYTQTKRSTGLQDIANGIPDLVGEYMNAPYVSGALVQVSNHVTTYLNSTGEAGITPTVVEVTRPTVQPDGSTYIGKYTVTLKRGTETANKTLTYTQTKRSTGLQDIANGIPDLAGEYMNAPYISGALVQVSNHVTTYLNSIGEAGITPTVVEVTKPTLQSDATTYIGKYTVTLKRGTETANKTLTYTQKKKATGLRDVANGIPDLVGEYMNAPYVSGALVQVSNHVTTYLDSTGEAGITPTVVEVTKPTVQPDGSTYIGKYTVTLKRGTEAASKTITYTQTKRR